MSLAAAHGVYAVVLNWNGEEENLRCVQALLAAGMEASHIVFVDNGSIRGSHKQVRARYPQMIWVQNQENVGYAAGANQGAQRALDAGAHWLFFINNDLDVDRGCLQHLLAQSAHDPSIGALGPRILLPGGDSRRTAQLWAFGGAWNRGARLLRLVGLGQPDGPRFQRSADVDFLTGAALLVRREAWQAVGGFEPAYFAYMEDVELSQRLHDAGWRTVCAGGASAVHHPSQATGGGYSARRKYMMAVNMVHLLRRRGTTSAKLRFWLIEVGLWPLLALTSPFLGRSKPALAKGLGLWHGLLGKRVTRAIVEPGGTRFW